MTTRHVMSILIVHVKLIEQTNGKSSNAHVSNRVRMDSCVNGQTGCKKTQQ